MRAPAAWALCAAPCTSHAVAADRLPLFHIIGNVTKDAAGSIKLEPINDCSGVTIRSNMAHRNADLLASCNHVSPIDLKSTVPRSDSDTASTSTESL